MPATFILFPALVIGFTAWILAWWFTRHSHRAPRDEINRLRNHALWLEQRLDTARGERWDRDMIVSLSDRLGAACAELARARRDSRRSTIASVR